MKGLLTEKMKKALTEMLFLSFLEVQPRAILEIKDLINEKSDSICKIQFPYAIVNRMVDAGYIREIGKVMTETRKKNFIEITPSGKKYLTAIKAEYTNFLKGVDMIFAYIEEAKAARPPKGKKK